MIKNYFYLLLLISSSFFAQDFKTPVDFLSFIGKEQENITKATWKYTSAVAHSKNARKIDNTRKLLLKSIATSTAKIKQLKNGYNGDIEFRDQVLTYLQFVENNMNQDYAKIIDLQEVAEQSYDFMEAYITARDLVNQKLNEEFNKVSAEQKVFADKYKINLIGDETELGKKMKISGEVFDYHTDMYLIFFKTNITDLLLSEAIQAKDLALIEQHSNSLGLYASEGLEKIKTIEAYKKDVTLQNATKTAMEYYKKQSETFSPKIVNFLMFQEKFGNAKKSLESKSKKELTQEEVDNYNTMVKQTNKEVDLYNKTNEANYKEKSVVINNWNNSAENFIAKHVPQE
jgi:hypothetical protein